MIERGALYWVDLGDAVDGDHRPAKRRPVLVVQADPYNRSRIATVLVAMVTSNLTAAGMPGNVLLPAAESGLPRDSVVNVTQILTLNRYELDLPAAGAVPLALMNEIDEGLRQVLAIGATR